MIVACVCFHYSRSAASFIRWICEASSGTSVEFADLKNMAVHFTPFWVSSLLPGSGLLILLNSITVVKIYPNYKGVALVALKFCVFLILLKYVKIPSDRWIVKAVIKQVSVRQKLGDSRAARFRDKLQQVELALDRSGTFLASDNRCWSELFLRK